MDQASLEGSFLPRPLLTIISRVLLGCFLTLAFHMFPISYPWRTAVQGLAGVGAGIAWAVLSVDRVWGFMVLLRKVRAAKAGKGERADIGSNGGHLNYEEQLTLGLAINLFVGIGSLVWIYGWAQQLR